MSAPAFPTLTPEPVTAAPPVTERASAAEIDASCRWPLLLLFVSAFKWLVLGTVLALLASIKLHGPGFLAGAAWLTYGRLQPAAADAFLYGFATQAGLGALLWMFCRLGGTRLLFPVPLVIAGLFWNLGVLIGVWGILCGGHTGFAWLEMSRHAAPILAVSFLVITLCALANFQARRAGPLYPSQWYLLAALFCFVWHFTAGGYLLLFDPVRGVMQAVVNGWFANGLLQLWLTPVALAAVFYFLPKHLGRPLHSHWLAAFGFWTLLLFANWSGLASLAGGPLPRWMTSASVAAHTWLLVPILASALNWHWTLAGHCDAVKTNLPLRFVVFGALGYVLAGVIGVVIELPGVHGVTQFTFVPVAVKQLALHGFIGLTLFGAIYDILPRLTQVAWPEPRLVRLHLRATVGGVALLVVPLALGGLVQGMRLNNPAADFVSVARGTVPYAGLATAGLIALLVGQAAFARNLWLLLRRHCGICCPALAFCCGRGARDEGGTP